ncbi:MAG TPA: hypothetical protein VJ925_05840, partial [Longimicrobiales bacterium]|nr:hypothetical protein [Longimicrobiales bacterium]
MTDTPTSERDPGSSDSPILTSRRRRRGGGGPGRGTLLALLGVVAAGVALWWGLSRGSGEGPESGRMYGGGGIEETVIVGDTTDVGATGTVATEPFPELPSLDESDPWLRDRATELSR